jgi:hypothetical protein
MVEKDIKVSQILKVRCFNVSENIYYFMEAINIIEKEKNPILHRYASMNSTKRIKSQ